MKKIDGCREIKADHARPLIMDDKFCQCAGQTGACSKIPTDTTTEVSYAEQEQIQYHTEGKTRRYFNCGYALRLLFGTHKAKCDLSFNVIFYAISDRELFKVKGNL